MFAWATLRKKPTWKDVEAVMNKLNEQNLYDCVENSTKLHLQFGYIKNYCLSEKINQWNSDKVSTVNRWVEIFNHLKAENCDYKEIATIAEYILCLPGSAASVERVFSEMNKTWTDEKTRLKIETLKAILTIKINLKMSCLQFYEYLTSNPEMLRQIASKEKYKTRTVDGKIFEIEDNSDDDKSND